MFDKTCQNFLYSYIITITCYNNYTIIFRNSQYITMTKQDKSTKKSVDIKITKKQPKRKTI